MKFTDFQLFYEESKKLFLAYPMRTRYTVKYRPTDQSLVVKVTDDFKTYTFETDSHLQAKEIDTLNCTMLKLMACPTLDDASIENALNNDTQVNTQQTAAVPPTTPANQQQKKKKGNRA